MTDTKVSRSWSSQFVDQMSDGYAWLGTKKRQAGATAMQALYAYADKPPTERFVAAFAEGATWAVAWPAGLMLAAAGPSSDLLMDNAIEKARTKLPPGMIEDLKQFRSSDKLKQFYLSELGAWYREGGRPPVPIFVSAADLKPEMLSNVTSTVTQIKGKIGSKAGLKTVQVDTLGSATIILMIEQMIATGKAQPKDSKGKEADWHKGYVRLKTDIGSQVSPKVWAAARAALSMAPVAAPGSPPLPHPPPDPSKVWTKVGAVQPLWFIPCNRDFGGTCKGKVPYPSWWRQDSDYPAMYAPKTRSEVQGWFRRLQAQGYHPSVSGAGGTAANYAAAASAIASGKTDSLSFTLQGPSQSFADKVVRPESMAGRPEVDVPNEDVRWWWDWHGEDPLVRAAMALGPPLPGEKVLVDTKSYLAQNTTLLLAGGGAAVAVLAVLAYYKWGRK